MKTVIYIGTLGLLAFAFVPSCSKDNVSTYYNLEACQDTVSYAQKIQPMILANCATSGCHDASTAESGYNLTSHASISANATILLSAMRHDAGTAAMPQGGDKLADSLIQYFSCWVYQGKKNN